MMDSALYPPLSLLDDDNAGTCLCRHGTAMLGAGASEHVLVIHVRQVLVGLRPCLIKQRHFATSPLPSVSFPAWSQHCQI